MNPDDFPAPKDGFVITHFLVVADQDRSRDFYQKILGGEVLIERDPVIMKVANTWLILNVGGGPTDDKPTVTLTTPPDPNRTSAFLNIRVWDIQKAYKDWSAKGATFLTEPKDHGREIRAYIRDPDGHLIEVGQATGVLHFPVPKDGFVITHFLVVADQDRSGDFYQKVFDAKVIIERDPVVMKVANSWLILNEGGGPTDDKPTVTLTTPPDPNRTSAFLNIRVADIQKAYKEWSAKGAKFLTEPKDHGREIRAYIRDPDGHLIEVGQTTGALR